MPAVVVRCGCRVYIGEAHVEATCDKHEGYSTDRYAVRDILADTTRDELGLAVAVKLTELKRLAAQAHAGGWMWSDREAILRLLDLVPAGGP